MRNRIIAALAALTLALGGVLIVAAPAQALPTAKCNISAYPWINATDGSPANWGKIRFCSAYDSTGDDQGWYPLIQVDDVLTDGYQVHAEFIDSGSVMPFHATGNGPACATVQSAGAVVESCWADDGTNSTWAYYGGNDLWVRLVKGRACCPHQNAGIWEYASEWMPVIST